MKKILLIYYIVLLSAFAKELENVKVMLKWTHQFQFAGYYVAKEKGFYEEEGLNVSFVERQYQSNVIESVLRDDVQYGIFDSSIIIEYILGKPLVMVAPIFQYSPLIAISLKEANITSPKDLENKKVMYDSAGFSSIALRAMLKSSGVDENSFTQYPSSHYLDDLIEKRIDVYDGYISNEPFLLSERNISYNIIDPKKYGIHLYDDILFTSKKELMGNSNRVEKFKRATIRGWYYALSHKEEIVDLIIQKYGVKKSREALLYEAREIENLIMPSIYPIGNINFSKINIMIDTFTKLGILNRFDYDLEGLVYKPKSISFNEKELKYLTDKKVIKMCVDPDWMPYASISNGEYIGIFADIMKLIKERTNLNIELYKTDTWGESLAKVKIGECDIVDGATITENRMLYMNFTTPIFQHPSVLVTKDNHPLINDISHLEGKKVAVISANYTEEFFKTHYLDVELVYVKNTEEGFMKVLSDEVVAFSDNLISISYTMAKLSIHNLKISGQLPILSTATIGVRSDEPILKDILQRAIDTINGQDVDKILQKWVNLKYEKSIDYSKFWLFFTIILIVISTVIFWNFRLQKEIKRRVEIEEELKELSDYLEKRVVEEMNARASVEFKYENIFHSIPEAIFISSIDKNGKISQFIDINHSATEMFGYSKDEFMVLSIYDIEKSSEIKSILQKVLEDEVVVIEREYEKKSGEKISCEIYINSFKIYDNRLLLIVIRDITAQKSLIKEKERDKNILIQQSKMAEMGNMLGAITHQWKQPLNSISILAQTIEEEIDTDSEKIDKAVIKELLNTIVSQVMFMSNTMNDFLNFFKPSIKSDNFELKTAVDETIKLLQVQFKKELILVRVNIRSNSEIRVNGYKNEFKQVILNLFNNAKDVIKEKREQKLISKSTMQYIDVEIYEDSQSIYIEIKDYAGAISDSVLESLFTPYFSTKDSNNGCGIGLYIVKSIIEKMDGKIYAKNFVNSDLIKNSGLESGVDFVIEFKK